MPHVRGIFTIGLLWVSLFALFSQATEAQDQQTPIGEKWWPSRWGPNDEAGASNWITPAKVLEAARLIKTGKIYDIGRIYETGMPLFGTRRYTFRIPGTPTGGPFGTNQLIYHDEFLATEIGQVGTQFDGLGHIGVQVGESGDMDWMVYYNGFTETQMADSTGLKKLGIEKLKPIFTRGILIDVAGYKGRMLEKGEEITVADVRETLHHQGIFGEFKPGDAIFFNTGWGDLWMKDNERFNSGTPGIGMAVARWIVSIQASVVGADTWPVEVMPSPDPKAFAPVHCELITKHGIFLHENLDFTELIKDGVFEFVYVMTPLRIKGATGSPGRPIAIR